MTRLSSRAGDTMLSSYRVDLPFGPVPRLPPLPVAAATLEVGDVPQLAETIGPRRRRLWELDPTLHCSIIGTCLTTGELREIVHRIARGGGFSIATSSDHDVHGHGVCFAQRCDGPGKLLHKALDRRHAAVIRSFASATDEQGVAARWQDAFGTGAIPGAYWSVLTHACTRERLMRRVFGEVHMLSHLVGASNRADIRRLGALEATNSELQTELATERRRWRQALSERDARLRALERRLESVPIDVPEPRPTARPEPCVGERLIALEARLAKVERARIAAEERCQKALGELALAREGRDADRSEILALRVEIDGLQQQMDSLLADGSGAGSAPAPQLAGVRVLVVGARPAQIARWRALVERKGGEMLHHDGGIDDNIVTLGGLVSRADLILFPVDCVSHEAMWSAKRLAAQQGKPYLPMRTASFAAFTRALRDATCSRVEDPGGLPT